METVIDKILKSAELAQTLLLDLYETDPQNETFEQVGFLDGKSIVRDFIDHNEWGCALDHLLYMIDESTIDFPHHLSTELHEISRKLNSDKIS